MRLLRRLWYLLRQHRVDTDLAEELELHRELAQRDLEESGLTPAEATVAARRHLGNMSLARDDARDVWGWRWLQDISQDVRLAIRRLAKDPRFTVAVILALGLGIGVSNSVFTVINTALIRDVPFDDPERLLDVAAVGRDGREVGLSYADYRDWSEAATLEGIGVSLGAVMNLSERDLAPQRLRGTYVSANTFGLLRSTPVLGRDFLAEDDRPGAPAVAIIGYRVWQERYGGDPSVIGRSVRLNDVATTIVGVMGASFSYPFISEVWQPLSLAPTLDRASRDARPFRNAIARLAATADLSGVEAELEEIAVHLARSFPDTNNDLRPKLQPMKDSLGGRQAKPMLMTFMGAVGFVLLIACANVANLLLVRATARSREIAIRAALGATRWRIVRELLIECFVLAAGAGAVGLVFSMYGAQALAVGFSPIEPGAGPGELKPFWVDLSIDRTVLAFVIVACLFATLAFGLVPALQSAHVDVNSALKDGARGDRAGGRARHWTSTFIIVEVALTIVLLGGTGLLWRSFYAKYRTELVVDTSNLFTAHLTLPVAKYDTAEKRHRFIERLEHRLADVPTFSGVAIASRTPLSPGGTPRQLAIEGLADHAGVEPPTVSYVYSGARYFETLRIQALRGRVFTDSDGLPGRESAVVDERFAALYFPGADPIGQRIQLTSDRSAAGAQPWLTIVGVMPAMPDFSPPPLRRPVVYAPVRAEPSPGQDLSIVVRGDGTGAAIAPALRDHVRTVDADLPIYAVETVEAAAARLRSPQRLVGSWLGVIALIGLVLSTLGLYALTAYSVAQRTQEIGIRMALGARPGQITWLFLRGTVAHLAVGLALGICGALATGHLLQSYLVDTGARDPLTLAGVVALLAIVAIVASLFPSRRAAGLLPLAALRSE